MHDKNSSPGNTNEASSIKFLKRESCEILGTDDLEFLSSFQNFPIFMGCVAQEKTSDITHNMDWWISRASGLIQLKTLIPLKTLYSESHGAGSFGAIWKKHHREFSRFIHRHSPTSVLEIGGAHGILANEYQKICEIPWTIVEPNPSPRIASKANLIKCFFDEKFSYKVTFDTVVHSQLLEHIYKPNLFMRKLSRMMAAGNKLVFSLPNMQAMLERKYTNCINFEHTIFLTEPYIEYLLSKHGFRIVMKEYFMDDHSIFYAAVRDLSITVNPLPKKLYEKNKILYKEFLQYHEDLIEALNQKILTTSGPIYLFGAHIFAQYLIAFGLDTSRIISILDNDPNKQGKRLYGTSISVKSPEVLRGKAGPIVILRAGSYTEEIKKYILENINITTVFFE